MRADSVLSLALLAWAGVQSSRTIRQQRGQLVVLGANHSRAQQVRVEGDHAAGLEAEHAFQLVSRDLSDASGWRVTKEDKPVLNRIIKMLNPPGADSRFAWRNEERLWRFQLIKLTAQTAKASLALHMLHHHGLAPVLAGRAGRDFDDFLEGRLHERMAQADPDPKSQTDLEFFVETQQEFQAVQAMRNLLEQLTLGALQNLHSYDHSWSWDNWVDRMPGCSRRETGGCILQAATSATAWNFLLQHGFTEQAAEQARKSMTKIDRKIGKGRTGLPETHARYTTPKHTGAMTPLVQVQESSTGEHYITGSICWEDGGRTEGLEVPVLESEAATIDEQPDGPEKNSYLQSLLERWMEREMAKHNSFMFENRLTLWSAELAGFWQMYPRYDEASQGIFSMLSNMLQPFWDRG